MSSNGAATLSLRKSAYSRCFTASLRHASMGPQLYRCGNLRHLGAQRLLKATLQWGRNFIVAEIPRAPKAETGRQSFNGAATLSLRKSCQRSLAGALHTELQWGRNFIVAEMLFTGGNLEQVDKLQWGRNFIVAEISILYSSRCFALRLQWGRNFIVAEIAKLGIKRTPLTNASMGPQLYRCGNM